MTLSQLFLVLRARRTLVLFILISCVAIAVAGSLLLPKTYKATATLVLNYTGIDPVTGIAYPGQMVPSYVQTQVGIIKSQASAIKVVKDLGLANDPRVQERFQKARKGRGNIEDWLAQGLLRKLHVVPAKESNVVEVVYESHNANEAAAIANAFATAYQATSLQLKVAPSRSASTYLNAQLNSLRDSLQAAQARLSAFQKEKGLSSADSRYDVESTRLSELSAQLVQVQGQLMDAKSRRANSRSGGSESPDVLASPLIQNLRAQVARAEATFTRTDEQFTPDHPAWQQAKAELNRLRAALANNEKAVTGSVQNQAAILTQREAELRTAVEAQKAKVMELIQARNQLALLDKDVNRAQEAYDSAFRRVNQTNLEGRFNQSDAALLNAAVPPFEPSFPKLSLNTALGVLFGILFGVGGGLLAELRDRRIRSAVDAADALQLPVLGSVDWTVRQSSNTPLFGQAPARLLT